MVTQYTRKIAVARTCTAISNISRTWEECWQGLLQGDGIFESGAPISANWPETAPLSMLSERAGWKEQPPFMLRFKRLAQMASADMRHIVDELTRKHRGIRINVIAATCHSDPGPLSALVDHSAGLSGELPGEAWDMLLKNSIASYLTEILGHALPVSIVSSACASALVATSYGADMIDADLCDAALVIALDGMARVASAGFHNIGAMAKNGCAPYDVNRTGTTVGEGAVAFLLAKEELLPAEQVYARIAGTAVFCDAAHMVEPNLEGVRCVVQEALDQAGIAPSDIAGIYWHGTGTKHNDNVEAQAARIMFGDMSPPCTSTKGSLGHTMGASGGYNILAACESNTSGWMTPVATLVEPEFSNLDIVRGDPRQIVPGPILVTALGFGGINAAVVVTPRT